VAVLDLHTARPGQRLFQLAPDQVRVPFGVQVLQVNPPSVRITFEKSATRELPVTPAIEGAPAPGFVIGKVTSNPAVVQVTGPQSAVDRATEATTEPVSVVGAHSTVTESVSVGFADPALRLKSPRLANVQIQVLPGPDERALRDRPIHLRNLGMNLNAQALPPTVEVVLRGTRQALSRVDSEAVTAFVDLAGLGPGEYSMAVRTDASQDGGVERIDPETVQIRVTGAKR
jgi:YbbR domain-containing protein